MTDIAFDGDDQPAPRTRRMVTPAQRPAGERQLWECVTVEGPPTACGTFRDDAHLGGRPVQCPRCGSKSARMVDE